MKKFGGILFLAGSIASIVIAAVYKQASPHMWLEVCSIAALVGALMTRSSGIIVWIIGAVCTYVGAKGLIPNTTVSMIVKYAGMIVVLLGVIFIWKDSIHEAAK